MKKCVSCENRYSDSMMRCPECGLFLIADVVSDLETPRPRARVKADTQPKESGMKPREKTNPQPEEPSLKPRPRVQARTESHPEEPTTNSCPREQSSYGSSFEERLRRTGQTESLEKLNQLKQVNIEPGRRVQAERRQTRRPRAARRGVVRGLTLARSVLPILLVLTAIVLFVLNWEVIKPFLTCMVIGALVGGGLLSYCSMRFGRYFNPDVLSGGAIIGAVLAVMFRYNVLDIGTELSEMLGALAPLILMVAAIWYLLRAMLR